MRIKTTRLVIMTALRKNSHTTLTNYALKYYFNYMGFFHKPLSYHLRGGQGIHLGDVFFLMDEGTLDT